MIIKLTQFMEKKMKVFRRLLLSITLLSASLAFSDEPEDRQMESIRKFIQEKRQVNLRKKSVDLTLSGDVRLEWQNFHETLDGVNQRQFQNGNLERSGTSFNAPYSNNEFDGTFNFMINYRSGKAWAASWLQYRNSLGLKGLDEIGGTFNKISSRQLIIGYHLVEADDFTLDVIAGRSKGYYLFNSQVMYGTNYDGIFFDMGYNQPGLFNMTLKGGPFIISSQDNHYGYTFQLTFNEIAGTGLYASYALIDWEKKSTTYDQVNDIYLENNPQWQFVNSQFVLGYRLPKETFGAAINVYGSYGFNSAAQARELTDNTKANEAWYLGANIGRIQEKGDWSLQLGYQSVGAQAIRDGDLSGYGRGNIQGNNFYKRTNIDSEDGPALGDGNYKGFGIEGAYAISDNLTFGLEYENTKAKNKNIGGNSKYEKFEAELVYAF